MRLLEVVRAIGWVVGLASVVLLVLFRAVTVMKQFGGLLEAHDDAAMRAEKTLAFWTWVLIAVALGGLGLFYLTEGCAQAT